MVTAMSIGLGMEVDTLEEVATILVALPATGTEVRLGLEVFLHGCPDPGLFAEWVTWLPTSAP